MGDVELEHMRRSALLKITGILAVFLTVLTIAFGPARAASPGAGRVSDTEPTTAWTGGPFLAANPTVDSDCVVPDVPFCDVFTLEVGTLTTDQPDVLVSVAATSPNDIVNLAIYDAAGIKVAESGALGSSQTVTLARPAPGIYSVRTELLLGIPGSSTYDGRAFTGAGTTPIDMSQECTVEQTPLALTPDHGRVVDLDVLVLLDGVDEAYARNFFTVVSKPYEELKVRVVPTFRLAEPPFEGDSSIDILAQVRSRFPAGKVPFEFDVVEVLTSKDLQLFGQYAVAGQADCLGGLAYDERSYNVSEAYTGIPDEGIPFGPVTLGANYAAKITAHEIGHLLGGQHHYANCVEGNDPDLAAEQADTSPCSLMFNAADFVSLHFGLVNGKIARGYAITYAADNDGADDPPVCAGKMKKTGCHKAG